MRGGGIRVKNRVRESGGRDLPGMGFCDYELAIVVKFTQHAENSGRFP